MSDQILVVDDEEIIRESMSFVLRKEGYTVTEAANGKEAYEKLLADTYDLVITDLEMPEMKGIELLDKTIQLNPQSMVMIITAYGSLDTAINALRKGACDYILKPLEFDELLVKIRRLLDYKKLVLENQILRREVDREYDFSHLVGKSPRCKRCSTSSRKFRGPKATPSFLGKAEPERNWSPAQFTSTVSAVQSPL